MNGWASDFQKLSMHEQPVPAQQFRQEAPMVRSIAGEWHTEFMRQRSSASTPISQGKQALQQPQMNNYQMSSPMSMNGYSQSSYGQFSGMYQGGGFQPQQQQQYSMAPTEQQMQQNNTAMEAAFADAFSQLEKLDQEGKLLGTSTEEPALQQQEDMVVPVDTSKIGADSIQYREWQDRSADQDTRDADELARTAGQLLTSVQHDTSSKFQNSNFLELMRRIRDREVEVQNNDLTNVATGEAATTDSNNSQMEPNGLFAPQGAAAGSSQQQHISNENAAQNAASSSHFAFPDMDVVYAPAAADLDESADGQQQQQQPALWATGGQHTHAPYTTYGFDDEQYRPDQQQPLHPGGKYYPDQSPRLPRADPEMSGAVPAGRDGINVSDFEYVDESGNLARRFQ